LFALKFGHLKYFFSNSDFVVSLDIFLPNFESFLLLFTATETEEQISGKKIALTCSFQKVIWMLLLEVKKNSTMFILFQFSWYMYS